MTDPTPHAVLERDVFFVSDGTGITSETFGNSVLTQFDRLRVRAHRISFVDSEEKACDAVARINEIAIRHGGRPIVFSTLVDPRANEILRSSSAMILDLFETFVVPLEQELGMKSTHTIGRFHTMSDSAQYKSRIEAINFALTHDDGQLASGLPQAEVILVGVSRSGKTPTSLYLAMQYGVKAANYPLIPEDFERGELPGALLAHRERLFGLTIAPERLAEVRRERRPNSRYASLENCLYEVTQAERLMRRESIRWLSSTTKSIEEIAATILQDWLPVRREAPHPAAS
jgi:[pyruvate, water dikinase]-phosphate phosphotransferase / [pyruvate, water dikinase] kinase